MRKRWVLLTSMLLLGSAGTAEAAPLDSPDIVYIDGLPCNRLCQSYMAWSRKASSLSAQAAFAPRFPKPRGATGMRGEGSRSATRVRLAKPAAPNSNGMRQAPIADSQPARNAVAVSNSGTQERVTAATAAPAPEQKAGHSDHAEGVLPGVAEKPASASSNNGDRLVAILVARPEIKSVSDLTNKNIAIDARQAASNAIVRTAIAAAGATEAQLIEGQTAAVDRLINGEVTAAVLALVSPQAADWFPEIAGYKILRVPLSPPALQARLEPAGGAAPSAADDPDARNIQQQVTAATAVAEHVMTLRDAQKTTPASPNNDDRVVLLMARAAIKSISDLAGKDIAIDDRHSASNDKVRTAIAAAGAAEVQLSEGQTKAIDRLIAGDVPAAVLTLVYPETGFPKIPGFKIFRIPLAPRSVQARLEPAGKAAAASDTAPAKIPDSRPAGGAAANSSAGTIQQQVTDAMVI